MNHRSVLYLLAFLEGAAVMVTELLGARMAAPTYGASLIVWTVILSVAVGGLALGYYTGGRLSERKDRTFLFTVFLVAAGLIVLMPVLAMISIRVLSRFPFWLSLAACSVIFFFPPVFLLGSTTPFITRLLSEHSNAPGKEAGRVFGISTLGGIAATFIAGFWIIPSVGLNHTALFTGIALGIVPFVFLLVRKKIYNPLLFLLMVFVSLKRPGANPSAGIHVLYRSEGLLGQLLVADVPRDPAKYDRVLFVNRMGQTWIDRETGRSEWNYVQGLASVASMAGKNPEVLLLGLGGGTVAKELEEQYNAKVDAVELDERIADVAHKWFGLSNRTNVIVDDARHYIRTSKKKYDLVIFDVFKGEVPPAHALTLECFTEVKELLKPGGFIVINFNGFITGKEGRPGRSVYKTLGTAGYEVGMIPTGKNEPERNILYVAMPCKGKNEAFPGEVIDPASVDFSDALVLHDDSPVLELINLPAAQRWREGYSSWTNAFTSQGIPLFE